MPLAAYGSTATVAKTEEELEDRHQSLFGDADSADDIRIPMPSSEHANGEHANGTRLNGRPGSNGKIPTQTHNGTDGPNPPRVSPHHTRLSSSQNTTQPLGLGFSLTLKVQCHVY